MKTMTKLACMALGFGTLVGCDKKLDEKPNIETQSLGLKKFEDCSELRSYVGEVIVNTMLNYRYGSWGMLENDMAEAGEDGGGSESGPTDYTTTNVQEEGVDEIDLVKTDGQYIYVAQERGVHIVDSWPVETAEKIATVELEGWARGLFLKGDKLIVFEQIYESEVISNWRGTRATIIDISDRSAPQVEREIDLDGYLADGRMVDGDIYMVLNHWLYLPDTAWDLLYGDNVELPEMDWSAEGEEYEAKLAQVRHEARQILRPHVDALVEGMDLDDILPHMLNQEAGGVDADVERMHSCDDIYRPPQISQFNILSLVHLDTETSEVDSTGLMADGWTIYASKENLYVAQSSRWWWWGVGDNDMSTQIHKFNLNDGEQPQYVSSGAVDGWIYDQFAMSEHDGYLRVATTDFNDWWFSDDEDEEEPANNLFVLRDDNKGQLRQVGEVTGMAPGERIYATRMMGERAYVVTFEQIDPLFTIDLSNPQSPKVVGELKIPGYSAYLHPIDEDHLLAVGVDGDEDGNLGGVAISVFDVSDFANPILAHKHVIESDSWSWSEALYDHHAFTFHRDVLSIPAYSYGYSDDEYSYFSGILSFSIDTDGGIEEIGRVNHRDLVQDSECLYSLWYGYEENVCSDWGWYASVRRSVYIEDNLFSISNYGVKVNDLNNPADEIARALFYPQQ